MLESGVALEDVRRGILAEYEVPEDVLRRDLEKLIARLLELKLIGVESS